MMKSCKDSANMICRIKENEFKILVERADSDKITSPFLFENGESPKVGNVYSDIRINKFALDHKTFDFVLDADVRMSEKYKDIAICADICDENNPGAQLWTPVETAHDTSGLNYHQEGNLKAAFGAHEQDRAAVLVYVDLTDESGTQTHAVKLEYEAGANIIHNVEHPRRQNGYIKFGNGTNPPLPSASECLSDSGKTFGAKKDNIVSIALYREPWGTADLDYLCDFGKCDPASGDYPILGIPIKGDFKIQEAVQIVAEGRLKPSVTCTISEEGCDGVLVVASSGSEYNTAVGCTVSGNTLHYDLTEYSWQKIYKEPGALTPKKYVYTISFDVHYKLHGGDILSLNRSYSSGGILNQGSDEKLSYLVLAWGCLEENTEILMADGSSRKIRNILIGECVRSANGNLCRVKNIWTGKDSDCYIITDERENAVTATSDHPFPTNNGWKRTAEIKAGDILLDVNGNSVRVAEIIKTDKTLNVVNLEFDSPTIIIANGFQTGDYSIQNGNMPE